MNEFNGNTVDVEIEKAKKFAKKFVPGVIIVVVLAVLLLNSIYIIKDNQNGVVLRFGKVSKVEEVSGPHLKVPFVDEVRKVDVQKIYNMEYGFRTAIGATEQSGPIYDEIDDEKTIIVDAANNNASIALIQLIIQYKISDPKDFLFKVADVEGTLRLALEDVVRTSVQSYTLDQAKTQKELIDKDIKPALQKRMNDYESGIEILLVGTQNVNFLPNVETAYQQKENANQYKQSKQEEAQRYYNTIKPQYEAEMKQIEEDAYAYKAKTIANANAAVAQFNALYEEYLNNPEILKEKYYIEAMTGFLTNNKIVVDTTVDSDIYKFYNFDNNEMVKEQVISDVNN